MTALGDTLFHETFGNGLSGDGTNGIWTTNGNDGWGSNDPNALWEYRGISTSPNNSIGSRGAYESTHDPIISPTAPNGFFIFDSDYLDNGGVAGAFGTGNSPTPHESWLISPTFSTVGFSHILINFHTYNRRFAGDAYILLSKDGGMTWGDSVTIMDKQTSISLSLIHI